MDIPNSSTNTRSRPSCRGTRSRCLKAAKSRPPSKKPDLEPRQRDERADALTPTSGESGRAIVIEPMLKHAAARVTARSAADTRTPEARLEEAAGLARAIDLNVVQAGLVPLNNIRPATYLGTGKVDE